MPRKGNSDSALTRLTKDAVEVISVLTALPPQRGAMNWIEMATKGK